MGIHLEEKFDTREGKTIKFMNDHLQEWAKPLMQAFGGTPENSLKYASIHQKKPIIFIVSAPIKITSLLLLSPFQFKARYRELTTLKPSLHMPNADTQQP